MALAACLSSAAGLFSQHPIQGVLRELYAKDLVYKAHRLKTAESTAWRKLIHYDSFLGRTHSEARDKVAGEFFASPSGMTDPEAELDATIIALFTDLRGEEPARCRYPAREIFLVKALEIDKTKLPPVNCLKYNDWLSSMSANSVSIVFASFYMGNPSSMFGHTFLRFHNKNRSALLDASFNYAAQADDRNAIVYAWLGMTGGFPGQYSMHPYYVKINEYNDMESRDLWEFPLDVTPDELHFMQAHLWELSSALFPYYYLDENCSYQLLTLLEATRPGLKLTSRWSLFVTPTDTLHTMKEAGLISKEGRYRAAVFTRYFTFFENASPEARAIFRTIRDSRTLPQATSVDNVAAVDMLLEFYKYSNDYNMEAWQPLDAEHYHRLLAWRAKAPHDSGLEEFVKADADKNPLNGFKSTEVRGGYFQSESAGSAIVGIRPALRELHDVSRGFSPWSQIQIMGFSLSYIPQSQLLRLEDFTVVDILALAPWQAHVRKLSFRLRTGLFRHDEFLKQTGATLSWDSTAAAGLTLPFLNTFGWFGMAQASAQVGDLWENTLRIAPGILTGFKANWSTRFASSLAYEIDYGLISNSTALQRVDFKNAIGIWNTWVLEVDLLYAFSRPLATTSDYLRITALAKTYF